MARTPERAEWLLDLFTTAMEHCGYGRFIAEDYDCDAGTAKLRWHDEPLELMPVDVDTMAKGLGVIRNAVMKDAGGQEGTVPHNARTGERLYFGGAARHELLKADRTNGEDGDCDVVGALAVLECAVFGKVVYA